MSAIRDAIVAFADTILQHFPPFRWDPDKEAAWADTLVRELSGFSTQVIERAAKEMVRTRKKPSTPLVSECIDACLDARKWVDSERNEGKLQIDGSAPINNLDWTGDRQKLATDLIMCALGKQAAKEGWIKSLWNFARKNGRLPQPNEIEGCKREHKEFHETYKKAITSQSPMVRKWIPLGDEMIKRQKDLAEYVLKNVR